MPTLYPFQRLGRDWLVDNARRGKGCLLADSMGLGKTAQTVCALSALFQSDPERFFPCVVLATGSTLYHWANEFALWDFPGKAQVVHASNKDPEHDVLACDVLISTARGFADAAYWHRDERLKGLVIDEADILRNPNTTITKVAASCASFLKLRWALSATPCQNRLQEFHSLFTFVEPGLLGDADDFKHELSDPIRLGTKATATPPQIGLATALAKNLYALIAPSFLRRTKAEHNQIKRKDELVLFAALGPAQRALYTKVETEVRYDENGRSNQKSFLTNHLLFAVLNGTHPGCTPTMPNAKLDTLRQMLTKLLANGERVAVFFKSRAVLAKAGDMLRELRVRYVEITGSTGAKARQDNIDAINDVGSNVRVLICTTRSAGHGINLLTLSSIVILSPDWNAAADDQAAARGSRPGSKFEVTTYRILTKDTIEARVYSTQLQKVTQSNLVLADAKEATAEEEAHAVDSVSIATSLLGAGFEVASHDRNVANMAIFFEEDRKRASARFEAKKKQAEERKKKRAKAKRRLPLLQQKIRKYLRKKPDGTPTAALIPKFQPILSKHGFTKAMFRDALHKAGRFHNGLWTAND